MIGTHVPVLKEEVIHALSIEPGKKYIDATVGLGGHTREIVNYGGVVLGIDQDREALEIARQQSQVNDKVTLVHGNFRDIEHIAKSHGFTDVDGVLFDLGISSMQLDVPERGMSYRFTDAPLDLRMDQTHGDTAAQLVNQSRREDLYDIFSSFGEEQLAHLIAQALCRARSIEPVSTVGDVVRVIEAIEPNEKKRYGVLSRVFQALRIAVNDELGSLKKGLVGAGNVLKPGGRLAVISFHSLEDRIAKQFMKGAGWDIVTKHPIRPSTEEIDQNRRSRSAKLRVATKKV